MKQRLKRAVMGLLVGGVIILGGGFASADYADGDAAAASSATITYTVASFRAIELTDTTIDFGTIRQGGVAEQPGPTILYGTTWEGDKISVYLGSAMANGVDLLVEPGVPTEPESTASDGACTSPGVTATPTVTVTSTESATPQPLVTGIYNCGYPESSNTATPYPSGSPVLSEATTSWASVATTIFIDTTNAEDTATPGSLASPQTKTLYFVIDG